MATQSKAPSPRQRKATDRQCKLRPEPAELVLEDDPTDPDNGDPAGWPEWTDPHVYTIEKIKR